MIPHSRPFLNECDYSEVLRVLRSGQIAGGDEVRRFEEAMASLIGKRAGAAVSSGTAALHLTLMAMGIGNGDEVIIPSYVCAALMNALNYVDAKAVLADIDPQTYNIAPSDIRKHLSAKTKAIIVPHMFGLAADMDEILSLGVPVIEDCALSIGSRYKSRMTGSMGVVSVFSFYATKILTTGEGGMVLSDSISLIEAIRDLNLYGDRQEYSVRYNYKMTDFQAALGMTQLKKLPFFIDRRKRIASMYTSTLSALGFRTPTVPDDRDHIFYRYTLPEAPPAFQEEMKRRGIDCRKPVFKPLHRYMQNSGYPNTDKVFDNAVSIPLYPALRDDEIDFIRTALQSVLG